jgi:hypothetical protein
MKILLSNIYQKIVDYAMQVGGHTFSVIMLQNAYAENKQIKTIM